MARMTRPARAPASAALIAAVNAARDEFAHTDAVARLAKRDHTLWWKGHARDELLEVDR